MQRSEILRRLILVPPTLVGVAVVVFVLLRVVPGDPISMMIPPGASAADIGRLRAFYGLDRPIPEQFGATSGAPSVCIRTCSAWCRAGCRRPSSWC
jgi:ABC-type dipeptide/oligopeptide/nickel transport system permease component